MDSEKLLSWNKWYKNLLSFNFVDIKKHIFLIKTTALFINISIQYCYVIFQNQYILYNFESNMFLRAALNFPPKKCIITRISILQDPYSNGFYFLEKFRNAKHNNKLLDTDNAASLRYCCKWTKKFQIRDSFTFHSRTSRLFGFVCL